MMKTKLVICVACVLITARMVASKCEIKNLKSCGESSGMVESFKFNGTCTGENKVAVFEMKKYYTVSLKFTPVRDAKFAKLFLKAKMGFFVFPIRLNDTDACSNKGLTCPLKANTTYTFTETLGINPKAKIYGPMKVTAMWGLTDEPSSSSSLSKSGDNGGNKKIFCVEIPVELVVKSHPKRSPLKALASTPLVDDQLHFREVY